MRFYPEGTSSCTLHKYYFRIKVTDSDKLAYFTEAIITAVKRFTIEALFSLVNLKTTQR
jgi:hypothetical protein